MRDCARGRQHASGPALPPPSFPSLFFFDHQDLQNPSISSRSEPQQPSPPFFPLPFFFFPRGLTATAVEIHHALRRKFFYLFLILLFFFFPFYPFFSFL